MNPGTIVLLVKREGGMPAVMSCGVIVEAEDEVGDCEVLFYHHPCPVPPDITWYVPSDWLMPVGKEQNSYAYAVPETIDLTF